MANRGKGGTDKDLPSNQDWIAGGAKNPDDFDSDAADEAAAKSGGKGSASPKQKKEKPKEQQA